MPWIKKEKDGTETVRAQDNTPLLKRVRLHEKLVLSDDNEREILVHWSEWKEVKNISK